MAFQELSQCERMLTMMRNAGMFGCTNRQFIEEQQVFNYKGRICDLRKAGHVIRTERVKEGLFRYILVFDAATGEVQVKK